MANEALCCPISDGRADGEQAYHGTNFSQTSLQNLKDDQIEYGITRLLRVRRRKQPANKIGSRRRIPGSPP